MSVALVAVTSQVLDLQALVDELAKTGSGDGAITPFVGLVRDHNQGRRVEYLEYEAYDALAVRALNRIVDEARQAWPDTRVAVHHRTGRLDIGEASIIIVANTGRLIETSERNIVARAVEVPHRQAIQHARVRHSDL